MGTSSLCKCCGWQLFVFAARCHCRCCMLCCMAGGTVTLRYGHTTVRSHYGTVTVLFCTALYGHGCGAVWLLYNSAAIQHSRARLCYRTVQGLIDAIIIYFFTYTTETREERQLFVAADSFFCSHSSLLMLHALWKGVLFASNAVAFRFISLHPCFL